jgi:tripartite-type tricarboxylate transporter receptor subunit TctC
MQSKLAAGLLGATLSLTVAAQTYPAKPIRLIVPFPPGGTVDISARAIAPALSESLGQNIIVDNRGGAQGMVGSAVVAKAPPDGYTLLMGSNSTLSVAPSLSPGIVQYNPVRDFAPITLVGATPFVLVVHPSVPAKTIKEFIALAKTKPGTMTMASGGVGHLVGELFQSMTGTKFIHVPYQGTGPAGIALMGGQVDLMFDQLATSVGPIKAGKTRALAVSFHKRAAALPEIPTMREAGVAKFEVTSITGVLAPAGTPGDIVNRLNAATQKVLALPATRERFATLILEPSPSTPEQFAAYIKEDLARWTKVVKDAGIKTE